MSDDITTFSGFPIQPSPGAGESELDPGDEIASHVLLDMLGLGGLGMVIFAMKFQGELKALNSSGPADHLNYKPTGFTPGRAIKPC
jgi:hypothetical protein